MSRKQFMSSSSNPFTSDGSFAKNGGGNVNAFSGDSNVMTMQGAIQKSFILVSILVISALASAHYLFKPEYAAYMSTMMYGSAIGGFVLVMISYFKPTIAPITAPIYAIVEGVFVGIISAAYQGMFGEGGEGIVFNAVMLTVLCLVSMLGAYKFGLIKPTKKFRSMIVTATGAIMLIYLVNMGLSFFGSSIPYLHEGGMIGIGISLFIIGIATLNLILDFDNIERGANAGAPKYMEWVTSLGLLVTLVWIYIEILRLLAMFSSND